MDQFGVSDERCGVFQSEWLSTIGIVVDIIFRLFGLGELGELVSEWWCVGDVSSLI